MILGQQKSQCCAHLFGRVAAWSGSRRAGGEGGLTVSAIDRDSEAAAGSLGGPEIQASTYYLNLKSRVEARAH
jgi:hypothetical protein